MTSETSADIARSLYRAPNLRELFLSYNPLGDRVSVLAKHLSCVRHLKTLRLEGVQMTKEQVNDLTTAVRHSKIASLGSYYHVSLNIKWKFCFNLMTLPSAAGNVGSNLCVHISFHWSWFSKCIKTFLQYLKRYLSQRVNEVKGTANIFETKHKSFLPFHQVKEVSLHFARTTWITFDTQVESAVSYDRVLAKSQAKQYYSMDRDKLFYYV